MFAVIDKSGLCPICGFPLEPADFTICPSCGVEFGIDTIDHTLQELRAVWVDNGMRWESSVDVRPPHWNPWVQMFRAGIVLTLPYQLEVRLGESYTPQGKMDLLPSTMSIQAI
jgi:hypothetical protein